MTPSKMMCLTAIVITFLATLHLAASQGQAGKPYAGFFDCPPDFTQRRGLCYLYRSKSFYWGKSGKSYCFQLGGAIASVSSGTKANEWYRLIPSRERTQVWNAAEQNSKYVWVDEYGAPIPSYWTSSYPKGPRGGQENCSAWQIQTKARRVVSNHCLYKNAMLCEAVVLPKPPKQYSQCPKGFSLTSPGRCLYNVRQSRLTLAQARMKCRSYGAYIAKMTSLEDYREIQKYELYTRNAYRIWIEIEDTKHPWETGRSSHLTYIRQSYYEPAYFSGKTCHYFVASFGRRRTDCSSLTNANILCETVPSRPITSLLDALRCPHGYKSTDEPGRCLKYIKTRESRVQAQRRCQQEGGNIASAKSWRGARVLASFMRAERVSSVWLDVLKTNGVWASEATGSRFVNWRIFSPGPDYNCTTLDHNGEATDSHCFTKKSVICEINTECGRGYVLNRGRCYRYFPQFTVNKAQAEALCKNLGAQLPLIRDPAENHVIHQMVRSIPGGYAWLQNTDDVVPNDFNVPFDRAWGEGEPNGGNQENCSAVFPNGKWLDVSCTYKLPVLCYKSLQDVNPEVAVPDIASWRRSTGRKYTSLSGYHCNEHWEMVNGRCYRLFTTPRTYADGEHHCQQHYATIAKLDYNNNTPLKIYMREMITGPSTVSYGNDGLTTQGSICINDCKSNGTSTTRQPYICVKDRFCPDPIPEYNRDSVLKENNSTGCVVYEHEQCHYWGRGNCYLNGAPTPKLKRSICNSHGAEWRINYVVARYRLMLKHSIYRFFCSTRKPDWNCPKEWQNRTDGLQAVTIHGQCYLNVDKRMTWLNAREMCWSYGGHLVEGQPKDGSLYNLNQVFFKKSLYWLGFSDISLEGAWLGSESNLRFRRSGASLMFREGQPNGFRRENCLAMRGPNAHDYPCNRKHHVICEARSTKNCPKGLVSRNVNTRCIKVFHESVTLQEARSNCQKLNLQLATFQQGDFLFVKALSKGIQRLWLGPECKLYNMVTGHHQGIRCSDASKQNYRAGYVCQRVHDFAFRTSNKNRCMPGLTLKSLSSVDFLPPFYGNFAEAELQCKKARMSMPDMLSVHCLYDAMQNLRLKSSNYARINYGPYILNNPAPQIINQNGALLHLSSSSLKQNKLLCADIRYRCNQQNVTVTTPDGVVPSFVTRDPAVALRMCQQSGKNLPKYSNSGQRNCIISFVKDTRKVQGIGNYKLRVVWMENLPGEGRSVRVSGRSWGASLLPYNYPSHVLCVG